MAKDNLVLVLTPHIIRTEDDMRRIFETRMQERQEFLDHSLVFGGEHGDSAGFDPARGRGLLGELRASHRESRERRELASADAPSEHAVHEPRPALDLPSASARVEPVTLQVEPPRRSVERVEH
jgi:general secretion pathway protein D